MNRSLELTAKLVEFRSKADVAVFSGGDGPEGPILEQRVTRLETDVAEIKGSLIRIEAMLKNVATKEDLANLRTDTKGEIAQLRLETREGMAILKADFNKQFGEGQTSTVKWITGLILPLYAALAVFAWQARQPQQGDTRGEVSSTHGEALDHPGAHVSKLAIFC